MFSERGQTLMELIVVTSVSVIIIGALVFATISSLRNAQFAKNQAQATKLAQEGIEKVRSLRDRGSQIVGSFTMNGQPVDSWKDLDLWDKSIHSYCITVSTQSCYFKFNSSGDFQFMIAQDDIPSNAENPLNDGKFKRVIVLDDYSSTYQTQKKVTVIVRWTDFSGSHESRLTTILRKI